MRSPSKSENPTISMNFRESEGVLEDDKADILRRIKNAHMPAIDENARIQNASLANIGISQLSVPLVWNSDQHFKSKGDHRTYSMFVVLQTKTQVVDSKMITNIDRSVTDVVFPEAFVFEGEPDDFCIELSLYAARTDQVICDNGSGSLRAKISRSFGRKIGTNVKNQLSDPRHRDAIMGGTYFNLLARALLVVTDAGNRARIHDLQMSAFADLSGPPLYGHIICRLVVQPRSVIRPIAEGKITVKPLTDNKIIRGVFARIQAGNLTCYGAGERWTEDNILLQIPITTGTKVVSTSWVNTFLLATQATSEADAFQVFITTEDEESFRRWKEAIERQVLDCEVWGQFAFTSTKLTHEKTTDPVKDTLTRAAGNRLYDKISIVGTVSKSTLSPGVPNYSPRELSPLREPSRTAPSRRNKQRANVLELFSIPTQPEPPKQIGKTDSTSSNGTHTEATTTYTPLSTKMRESMANGGTLPKHFERPGAYKKSWSKSLGEFIGRKINGSSTIAASTPPTIQVTRL